MWAFYSIWLLLCVGWGYLLSMLSSSSATIVSMSLSGILGNVILFGALFFAGLWIGQTAPSKAVLNLSGKPWIRWPASLQFVCATFVAAGLFGAAFAGAGVGTISAPVGALTGGSEALVGLWLSCYAYRRIRGA